MFVLTGFLALLTPSWTWDPSTQSPLSSATIHGYLADFCAGVEAAERGDWMRAEASFRHCLIRDELNPIAAYHRACALEHLGDRAGALESLEAAIRSGYDPAVVDWDPDLKWLRADDRYPVIRHSSRGSVRVPATLSSRLELEDLGILRDRGVPWGWGDLAVSPDESVAVVGARTLRFVDLHDGQTLFDSQTLPFAVTEAEFTRDGRHLLVRGEPEKGRASIASLRVRRHACSELCCSASDWTNSCECPACHAPRHVELDWLVVAQMPLAWWGARLFSPDHETVVAPDRTSLMAWSTRDGSVIGRVDVASGPIVELRWSSDSTVLAIATDDDLYTWKPDDRQPPRRVWSLQACSSTSIATVAFDPVRDEIAVGLASGRDDPNFHVILVETVTGRAIADLIGVRGVFGGVVDALAYSETGERLVATESQGVFAWSPNRLTHEWQWRTEDCGSDGPGQVVFLAGGTRVFATGSGCFEHVLGVDDGAVLWPRWNQRHVGCTVSTPGTAIVLGRGLGFQVVDSRSLRTRYARIESAAGVVVSVPGGWVRGGAEAIESVLIRSEGNTTTPLALRSTTQLDPKRVRAWIAGVDVRAASPR